MSKRGGSRNDTSTSVTGDCRRSRSSDTSRRPTPDGYTKSAMLSPGRSDPVVRRRAVGHLRVEAVVGLIEVHAGLLGGSGGTGALTTRSTDGSERMASHWQPEGAKAVSLLFAVWAAAATTWRRDSCGVEAPPRSLRRTRLREQTSAMSPLARGRGTNRTAHSTATAETPSAFLEGRTRAR